MAIANMRQMLRKARDGKYAVGACNILDYNSMRAVVDTAVELAAPAIIQTSVKTIQFWGYEPIIQWYRQLAAGVPVPVAIHLDHCKDLGVIRRCIDHGWTSVMIDASSKPFEENLSLTKQVAEMAAREDVSVEAELGAIVGVEDDIHVKAQDEHLADPVEAEQFCSRVELDCFAPAIGTAHGIYKGEPKIAFDRIGEIARCTNVVRLDAIANESDILVDDAVLIRDNYGFKSAIIAGSMKTQNHVLSCLRAGVDIVTVNPGLFFQMFLHPLTDIGLAEFARDWKKVPK